MFDIKALREELQEFLDEAQAITNIAEKEERDFSEDEQARWNALMDADNGLVAKKRAEVEKAEKLLAERKALAAARHAQRVADNPLADIDGEQAPQATVRIRPHNRLTAFKGESAARDAHDCGMWLRAALARDRGRQDERGEQVAASRGWGFVKATATEGTNSAGGYLVPDPLSAAFIEYRESVGIARQLSDIRVMTSDTLSIPKLTSGPTVKYPGEATATTASDQTWGQIALSAVKRTILSKISNELAEDALINVMDQLVSRMAYEFAKQEDNEWLNGDGTATYGGEAGLLNNIGAGGVNDADTGEDTWAELDIQDFTDTMGLLPSEYASNTAWVCSTNFYHSTMLRVMAEAGGNTIASLTAGPNGMPMFLGRPVYMTDQMPTASAASTISALYGTFSDACIIGDRVGLSLGMSDQRYFEEDVIAVLGRTRYDINWHNIGGASTAGAVVALKTAS